VNNLETVINVLASHREARQWTDTAVADDILSQLDVDPTGEAKNAAPVIVGGITEDEVIAAETAAKEAADKATAARDALNRQTAAPEYQAKIDADAAAEQAKADAAAADDANADLTRTGRGSRSRG
jgi:hypothetical protein